MLYGCIDIGSNTTRLLVAGTRDGQLEEALQQRSFTRLGKGLRKHGKVSPKKVAEVAEVVATQVRLAEEVGAQSIRAVGTAAIRQASNRKDFCQAVKDASGLEVTVLSGEDEARLAFVGATRTLGTEPEGEVGVVDVGGGSSEIALGTLRGGVTWSTSLRVGSGFLAEAYLRSDPPGVDELDKVRQHAEGAFEGLRLGAPDLAVAVGGSATSLRRLVGAVLDPDTLERGLRVLASAPADEVARKFELDPERVRLLPAGMLVLEAASQALGRPLQIGRGGLREGIIFEMASDRRNGTRQAKGKAPS